MPYIVMRRTDIPEGTLQVYDLKPNDSQRNYIYDPPGQSGYVRNIPTQSTIATTGAGPIITNAAYTGLGAYLIDRVEDQAAGQALTAAICNTTVAAIVAIAQAGTDVTAAVVGAQLVAAGAGAGTDLTAGTSTGVLTEFLGILAGHEYTLPAGTGVETAGNLFVVTISGSFTNEYREIFETGIFQVSNGAGLLFGYKQATFEYLGTAGAAVAVYADDGTAI